MNKKLILLLSTLGFIASCGGGGGTGDTIAPTLLLQTPSTTLIDESVPITLIFDESMDSTNFSLSGELASESDGGV